MHLVAVLSSDTDLSHALRAYRDAAHRFLLHPVPVQRVSDWLPSLKALDFAGALVLADALQPDALAQAERASLEATEVGAADALTVTPAGIIAEYHFGAALVQALRSRLWEARGARAVLLGGGREARAAARALASQGVRHLTLVARTRPDAERLVPRVVASTDVVATLPDDPITARFVAEADLVVRFDASLPVPTAHVGPHLTVVDLVAGGVSALRREAMAVGALTLDRRDVEAHRLHLALGHVLGGGIAVEPLLQALLHDR